MLSVNQDTFCLTNQSLVRTMKVIVHSKRLNPFIDIRHCNCSYQDHNMRHKWDKWMKKECKSVHLSLTFFLLYFYGTDSHCKLLVLCFFCSNGHRQSNGETVRFSYSRVKIYYAILALNSVAKFIGENALAHGALEQCDVCKKSRFSSIYTVQMTWARLVFLTHKNSATAK